MDNDIVNIIIKLPKINDDISLNMINNSFIRKSDKKLIANIKGDMIISISGLSSLKSNTDDSIQLIINAYNLL